MAESRFGRLQMLREQLEGIEAEPYPSRTRKEIDTWIAKARPIIRGDWPEFLEDFSQVSAEPSGSGVIHFNRDFTISEHESRRLWRISNEEAEQTRRNILNLLDGMLMLGPSDHANAAVDRLLLILKRFSIFSRQLRERGRGRTPFAIDDEYDLQYLLLALLRLHFEDVRPEEWTPSYAGGSSRMDFLLKHENIIVEAKFARSNHRDRQIADELIIDTDRYAKYPDYNLLACLVYDPDGFIENPRGLEKDLSHAREEIETIILVSS